MLSAIRRRTQPRHEKETKMEYSISLECLGEFRMGVNGYGITIRYKDKQLDFLSDKIVFAHSDEPDIGSFIEEIKNEPILVIDGAFSTFFVNLETAEASLFKHTVRTSDGAWSEECPIYGNETYHFNGKSGRHYYVQFPFVPCSRFKQTIEEFEELRIKQISEAKKTT